MNDDETPIVPVNGSEAQPESTQTPVAVVPSPVAQAPALSLTDFDRLWNEREAKLRAEVQAEARKTQSKSDKAYAKALSDAKVIEKHAALLGIDPEQVKTAKQAVIDQTFTDAFEEPEAQPNSPSYQPLEPISKTELAAWLENEEPTIADRVDLTLFDGRDRNNPQVQAQWEQALRSAKRQVADELREERQRKAQVKAEAGKVAQVQATIGSVGAPVMQGMPSSGVDPEKEMERLLEQGPPNNPAKQAAYYAELDKYEKALQQAGKWK